jgi:hypothetical protein
MAAATNSIEKMKEKFLESGHSAEIPLFRGKTFQAILNEKGITVSNLASQSFLP